MRQPAADLAGTPCRRHLVEMAGKDNEREERLAAALRENLRRRKAQSREIDADKEDSRTD